jgi:hypothetical protein
VSPRITNSSCCRRKQLLPSRSNRALFSITTGWPNSDSTSSRMIAPKPQQMHVEERQAEDLGVARAASWRSIHGQSFEGITNAPPVARASARTVRGRQVARIGSSTTSIGHARGQAPSRLVEQRARRRVDERRSAGGVAPCVGRPSVIRTTWSGLGDSVADRAEGVEQAGAAAA